MRVLWVAVLGRVDRQRLPARATTPSTRYTTAAELLSRMRQVKKVPLRQSDLSFIGRCICREKSSSNLGPYPATDSGSTLALKRSARRSTMHRPNPSPGPS